MATVTVKRMNLVDKKSLRAFADIDINGVILIYGCRLMDGTNGMWVGMPQRQGKKKDGTDTWFDIVKITKPELQDQVVASIVKEYERLSGSATANAGSRQPGEEPGEF